MSQIINNIIVFALINAGVLTCLYKWGAVDNFELRVPVKWCDFCVSFWFMSLPEFSIYLRADLINFVSFLSIFFYALATAAATIFFFKPDRI